MIEVLRNWTEEQWNAHQEHCKEQGILFMWVKDPENWLEDQPTLGIDTRYLPEQPSPDVQAEVRSALEQAGTVDGWPEAGGVTWILEPNLEAADSDIWLAWTRAMVALGALPPGPAQEPDERIRRIFGESGAGE